MASVQQILDQLSIQLGIVVAPGTMTDSADSDRFEAYVWSLVLQAAEQEGATVTIVDRDGNAATELVFRTSPGKISAVTNPLYTHAVLAFPGCPELEAHIGIRVQARSGILHECDVLVLPRDEANACRDMDRHPRGRFVVLAIECKYYVSSTPPLGLARSFLGLTTEIRNRDCHFVFNTQSNPIQKVLSYYDRRWSRGVDSGTAGSQQAIAKLRTVFEQFTALNWNYT